jgi:hypothetical protein
MPSRTEQRLAGLALLGKLLSSLGEHNPGSNDSADWLLSPAASGAPKLLLDGEPSGLSVSFSHSGAWLAAAVSNGPRIGVDIESGGTHRNFAAMANYLGWPTNAGTRDGFLLRWTLWEACVKMNASSIFAPCDAAFDALTREQPSGAFWQADRWAGVQFREAEGAHFAFALEQPGTQTLRFRIMAACDPASRSIGLVDDIGPDRGSARSPRL